jgi:hypothetical protein
MQTMAMTMAKPVNCKIINDILAYCNITINDEILQNLINSPRIVINNLDTEGSTTKKIIKDNLGLPSSKIQVPGVYIFTHKITGQKYVGSSSQLAVRLSGYLNNKYKTIGKFLPLLNNHYHYLLNANNGHDNGESFFNFTLEIIPLYNNYSFRSARLTCVSRVCTLACAIVMVMNQTRAQVKQVMKKDFIVNLNISHFTFIITMTCVSRAKHLNKGSNYLGKYLFSRFPEITAKVKDISKLDLALQLEKDRKIFNKNKPLNSLSRSVLLIDANTTKLFFSIGKCISYLRNKGLPATQTTLVKYIDKGKTYHGFYFKYV